MAICVEFAWRVRRSPSEKESSYSRLRESLRFKAFLFGTCAMSRIADPTVLVTPLTVNLALALATFTIFIRSVYRVAELEGGFDSVIANNKTAFIILEGPMIVIATVALTLFHPGYCFNGNWDNAGFSLRSG
jgi:RTA1 like protein